jgi:hypothetical protein
VVLEERKTLMSIDTNARPLEVYRKWNNCLLAGDLEGATELVDEGA